MYWSFVKRILFVSFTEDILYPRNISVDLQHFVTMIWNDGRSVSKRPSFQNVSFNDLYNLQLASFVYIHTYQSNNDAF